jgi:hypothetical protein
MHLIDKIALAVLMLTIPAIIAGLFTYLIVTAVEGRRK